MFSFLAILKEEREVKKEREKLINVIEDEERNKKNIRWKWNEREVRCIMILMVLKCIRYKSLLAYNFLQENKCMCYSHTYIWIVCKKIN